MATTYQVRSAAAQVEVFSKDFYTSTYHACLKQLGMTQTDVEKMIYPNSKLNSLWEEFWWKIPDSTSIRREPFFMICDLCEDIDCLEDQTQV